MKKEKGEKGEARHFGKNLKELVGAAGKDVSWSDEDEELSSPLMAFLDKAVWMLACRKQTEYQRMPATYDASLWRKVWNPIWCSYWRGKKNIFPSKMSFEEPGTTSQKNVVLWLCRQLLGAMEKLYIT